MAVAERADIAVVGGGIVGLATSLQLLRSKPDLRLVLLEREPELARHQSSHNSGVVHSGLYYTPGSLKARLCRAGKAELEAYCAARWIEERGDQLVLETSQGPLVTNRAITCGGLHADRLAAMTSDPARERIIPFRGDYYTLKPEARDLVRGLIYPVADPRFPFLGVHFTRRIDGAVWAGPNAVLAFAREGYRRRDISLPDLLRVITYP